MDVSGKLQENLEIDSRRSQPVANNDKTGTPTKATNVKELSPSTDAGYYTPSKEAGAQPAAYSPKTMEAPERELVTLKTKQGTGQDAMAAVSQVNGGKAEKKGGKPGPSGENTTLGEAQALNKRTQATIK